MRLFYLTLLTMLAFAANSVLNRAAVGAGLIDPLAFAVLRLIAGAAMLGVLLIVLRARRGGAGGWHARAVGVVSLLSYLFGFSLAYGALDAGAGALILFGMVQITMFAGAVLGREAMPARRWVGAALAFAQALPSGVYVAMNGRVFPHNGVQKNRQTGLFEAIA